MHIHLSEHFSYGKLLRFTFPTIVMLIFTSIYGVVDGFFVSNFVGKTPFAAVNLIMPYLMILGFLLGSLPELFPGFPQGRELLPCAAMAAAGFLALYKMQKE